MKMLNAALIIASTLTSGIALAEQGSGEYNRIDFPNSASTQYDNENRHYSFSNFKHRSRQAAIILAKQESTEDNRFISSESTSATQYDSEARHFSLSDLPEINSK